MDRSPRAGPARRFHLHSLCILVLVALVGCQRKAPAPASPKQPLPRAAVARHIAKRPPAERAPFGRLTEVTACPTPETAAKSSAETAELPLLVAPGERLAAPSAVANIDVSATASDQPPTAYRLPPTTQQPEEIFTIREEVATRYQPTEPPAVTAMPSPQVQPSTNVSQSDPGMLLPWGPSTPCSELTATSQRAEQAVRRGFGLAERGALYSARSQFIEALRILSEALDAQRQTAAHTRALGAGLRALEEVNDFVPVGARLGGDLRLQMIVDAHRTPVLKHRSLENITAAEAQRMYLTYAQEQLAAAGGDQPVTSLAMHGLGKICTAPAELHGPREQLAEAKAVVFYQAALAVAPQNFMAANELGVVLVRFGRLMEARTALEHAVAMSQAPASLRNLAVVCDRLGDAPKAAAARRDAESAVARLKQAGYANAGAKYPIEWIDPETFSRTNSMVAGAAPSGTMTSAATTASPASTSQPVKTAAQPETKKGGWPWPWK